MKYLKRFSNLDSAVNYEAPTPFVGSVKGNENQALFAPRTAGETVIVINDGNGFIKYKTNEGGQPNNEIWYTTTDGNIFTTYTDDDNHTPIVGYTSFLTENSIFDETTYVGPAIISETYEDGVWKVKFASDLTIIGSFNNGGNVYPYFATGDADDNLKTVSFPSSVTTIGGTFWANINLTSITIREGVTTIGDMVFAFSIALTDLTLPASLTSIGEYVFYSCQSLTTLNYAGTKEQWYNITKASDWYSNSSITKVICSDGELTGTTITVKPVFDTNTDINYDTFDELLNDF